MGKPWRRGKEKFVSDAPFDYKWSSQSYSMKDILNNFKLPVVVQCREDTNAEHVKNFFFDLRQPIVLHSKRTIRKIFARCIRKGDGGGTVKELLPEVVIPEDYAGWFKISKGLNFAKPTPHKTVESLTRSNSEFFLCTTEFNAIVITVNEDDDSEATLVRPVAEGEVLRKTGVHRLDHLFSAEAEQTESSLGSKYLMCIDDKDCELFIPVRQKGLFYEVSDGSFSKNDNSIVQVSDILDELVELPIYVRHILGDPPPISKFYSPCLKLCRSKEEECVMGSTLDAVDDILPLELQTNSPVKFEIALNTPMLNSCMDYMEAVEMCNSVGQTYITDMKLAVTFKLLSEEELSDMASTTTAHTNQAFTPDESEMDAEVASSIANSQRTSVISGSELGEVDAKSEFTIQWDPSRKAVDTGSDSSKQLTETAADSVSLDSLDLEEIYQLHSKVDSLYTQDSVQNPFVMWQNRFNVGNKQDTSTQNKNQMIIDPAGSIDVTPFVDIVEGVTDFSVRSASRTPTDLSSVNENCHEVLTPPSPFQNESGIKINPLASSGYRSSSSTLASGVSDVDLSDYFPSIHSSSNESLKCESNYVNRTSDARYSNCNVNGEEIQRNLSQGAIAKHWGDVYKVVKKRETKANNSIVNDVPRKSNKFQSRTQSLSDDLIQFDDCTSDVNSVSSNGIITCRVADEMVSSYNDLRLSLEEVTRNAWDNHTENSWRTFCLERSSSLPVRTRNPADKGLVQTEDHSQSWEQISPRRSDDTSNSVSRSPRQLNAKCNNLNESFNASNGDKTKLICDTSSEDGGSFSHRSGDFNDSANNSFTLSEASDMSVTDGHLDFLATVSEMDAYLDTMEEVDGTVKEATTLTRDKTVLAQRMQIKREIKRKKLAEWNDVVEVI